MQRNLVSCSSEWPVEKRKLIWMSLVEFYLLENTNKCLFTYRKHKIVQMWGVMLYNMHFIYIYKCYLLLNNNYSFE